MSCDMTVLGRAGVGARRDGPRGYVDRLPSGSWRVRVYLGIDAVTGRQRYAAVTVPDGPTAALEIEDARWRLLGAGRGGPGRVAGTVGELVIRHIALSELSDPTRQRYVSLAATHILPLLGQVPIRDLAGEHLDECYALLLRCRSHCDRVMLGERGHVCRPLHASTVRKIHFLIGGACRRAVRWGWLARNPCMDAQPPRLRPPCPCPPTSEQAARILAAAWADPDRGPLVWLAMVTGARRGELCAVRWSDLDPVGRVLVIERSIAQMGSQVWEKDTKLHARRHIVLDAKTVAMLTEYRGRREERAARAGTVLSRGAFVFSPAADGHRCLAPASVTNWYRRLTRGLGITTTWHKLRHYSATTLITAGVDLRTVAGRLGHADGGTTLKYYTAWVREADQRASAALARHLPLPDTLQPTQPQRSWAPYQRIADDLRTAIHNGRFPAGATLPTTIELAATYRVAPSTAHRAVTVLARQHLVTVAPGHRAQVGSALARVTVDHLSRARPVCGSDSGHRTHTQL